MVKQECHSGPFEGHPEFTIINPHSPDIKIEVVID